MLYYLMYSSKLFSLNIMRYVSFRSAAAAVIAFIVSVCAAPSILKLLKRSAAGRAGHVKDVDELSKIHSTKKGIPVMGGVIVILGILSGVLLMCDLTNIYVITGLFVVAGFGLLGFVDDYIKVFSPRSKGLSKTQKLVWQFIMAALISVMLQRSGVYYKLYPEGTYRMIVPASMTFPGFKDVIVYLGPWLFPLWTFIVIGGSSNGVNLTDGLDGLASGCLLVVITTFGVITYAVSRVDTSAYLLFLYVPGAQELVVFCMATAGACMGFLWYNSHPAEVFMGDTGSLFLGAFVGYVALVIKQEFLLVLIGGIFVIETGSVILQVCSFRMFGKRIFKVAPIHHHFEMGGLSESKITIRFWIVQIILALLCLASMKLR